MVIFHSYVSLPEGSGDAVNCSQTWWLPLRIKKTTHHNFRPVKPLPSGCDIHSLPWKDPPMLLSSVNHLFRLGPSIFHGELLVITRLGIHPMGRSEHLSSIVPLLEPLDDFFWDNGWHLINGRSPGSSTIFWAIFSGDIPWKLGLKKRLYIW